MNIPSLKRINQCVVMKTNKNNLVRVVVRQEKKNTSGISITTKAYHSTLILIFSSSCILIGMA